MHICLCRHVNAVLSCRDTEDYINIDLDSSQNRLFRLDIVLTGATFAIAIFEVFAGERRPAGAGSETTQRVIAAMWANICTANDVILKSTMLVVNDHIWLAAGHAAEAV